MNQRRTPSPMNAVLRYCSNRHSVPQIQATSGKVCLPNQDMARTVAPRTVSASASNFSNSCKGAIPLCNQQRSAKATSTSWWLALRAGVLRRAVSSTTRPILHQRSASVTVGREALQHLRGVHTRVGLRVLGSMFNPKSLRYATSLGKAILHHTNTLRPNHSLNRTHCGMRLKARHFILGF